MEYYRHACSLKKNVHCNQRFLLSWGEIVGNELSAAGGVRLICCREAIRHCCNGKPSQSRHTSPFCSHHLGLGVYGKPASKAVSAVLVGELLIQI